MHSLCFTSIWVNSFQLGALLRSKLHSQMRSWDLFMPRSLWKHSQFPIQSILFFKCPYDSLISGNAWCVPISQLLWMLSDRMSSVILWLEITWAWYCFFWLLLPTSIVATATEIDGCKGGEKVERWYHFKYGYKFWSQAAENTTINAV